MGGKDIACSVRYKIIAKVVANVETPKAIGYVITDGTTKQWVELEKLYFLAAQGLVDDVRTNFGDLIAPGMNYKAKRASVLPQGDNIDTVTVNELTAESGKYNVTKVYRCGRKITGYGTDIAGRLTKEQVQNDAMAGKIGNIKAQIYNGSILIRGNGISLNELPVEYEEAPACDTVHESIASSTDNVDYSNYKLHIGGFGADGIVHGCSDISDYGYKWVKEMTPYVTDCFEKAGFKIIDAGLIKGVNDTFEVRYILRNGNLSLGIGIDINMSNSAKSYGLIAEETYSPTHCSFNEAAVHEFCDYYWDNNMGLEGEDAPLKDFFTAYNKNVCQALKKLVRDINIS
jgi:hypothetical protein